jgi:hypothetical protein
MTKKINLRTQPIRRRQERCKERDEEDRRLFLENFPTELAKREFRVIPAPAEEVARVVHMDSGYTYTEYKSLAKLSVPFERGLGLKQRPKFRTLPDVFEVTEIVYSGVGVDDDG